MTIETRPQTQEELWNTQHTVRGQYGREGIDLRDIPNQSAVTFGALLNPQYPQSTILEIGCANGRDARYWAALGHRVIGVDFSRVALDQMMVAARTQNISHNIHPLYHDITNGLPENLPKLNGFYARSSLHIADQALDALSRSVSFALEPKSLILIEGKSQTDPKISRSLSVGDGLYQDPHEDGHVRRLWTQGAMETLAHQNGWKVIELFKKEADTASFVRMIAETI